MTKTHHLITMKDGEEYKLQSHLEMWEQEGDRYITGFTIKGLGVFLKFDDIKTIDIVEEVKWLA